MIIKQFTYGLIVILLFTSCKTSMDYLSRSDNDNTIFDVVRALKKNQNDSVAIKALPVLYELAHQRNLRKINSYSNAKELSRWDKMIDSYGTLQNMHDAIIEVDAATKLVNPVNYQQVIYNLKEEAAEDYYMQGNELLNKPGRGNSKKAYSYFKKITIWLPDYKDSKVKMEEAYQNTILNVVINPVQDNSIFINNGWGNVGSDYSIQFFQQTLVRELGGNNSNRYHARFYTDWEARRNDIHPNWEIDITLRNLYIPMPQTYYQSRNYSKNIEVARDTSGKRIYQTVYATVYVTRHSFTANCEIIVNITEVTGHKSLSYNVYHEDYYWQTEEVTYNGDSRAIDNYDLNQITNNRMYNKPTNEFVLNELYRKIYPRIKNDIIKAVDW